MLYEHAIGRGGADVSPKKTMQGDTRKKSHTRGRIMMTGQIHMIEGEKEPFLFIGYACIAFLFLLVVEWCIFEIDQDDVAIHFDITTSPSYSDLFYAFIVKMLSALTLWSIVVFFFTLVFLYVYT